MSDAHNELRSGNNYNHWKTLVLVSDLNYIYFSNPVKTLTWHTYLNTKS